VQQCKYWLRPSNLGFSRWPGPSARCPRSGSSALLVPTAASQPTKLFSWGLSNLPHGNDCVFGQDPRGSSSH
jgi:hypothetical protein